MQFLTKLYRMTNNEEHSNCIQWSDSCFWVSDMAVFTTSVLPTYFKHNNYASFVRQLNMYGFRRNTTNQGRTGPGGFMVETFCHPMFQKGRKELLVHIHRKPATRGKSDKAAESSRVNDLEETVKKLERELAAFRTTVEMNRNEIHLLREAMGVPAPGLATAAQMQVALNQQPHHHGLHLMHGAAFVGSPSSSVSSIHPSQSVFLGHKTDEQSQLPLGLEPLSASSVEQAFLMSQQDKPFHVHQSSGMQGTEMAQTP